MVNYFSLFFPRITTKEKRELVYHAPKVLPHTSNIQISTTHAIA